MAALLALGQYTVLAISYLGLALGSWSDRPSCRHNPAIQLNFKCATGVATAIPNSTRRQTSLAAASYEFNLGR